jgi:DNA-binding NtrC family response regulator
MDNRELDEFVAKSDSTKNLMKIAKSMDNLHLSILIVGKSGSGKKNLAKYIFPDAKVIDASIKSDLSEIDSNYQKLIIYNFDLLPQSCISKLSSTQIVALTNDELRIDKSNNIFGVILRIPELSTRQEDAKKLSKIYFQKAKKDLGFSGSINLNELNIEKEDSHSIKLLIYKSILKESLDKEFIMGVLENYFNKTLSGNNEYQNNLGIFEIPLIKSAINKYKYKVRVANLLGINRNTLKKKINEYRLLD